MGPQVDHDIAAEDQVARSFPVGEEIPLAPFDAVTQLRLDAETGALREEMTLPPLAFQAFQVIRGEAALAGPDNRLAAAIEPGQPAVRKHAPFLQQHGDRVELAPIGAARAIDPEAGAGPQQFIEEGRQAFEDRRIAEKAGHPDQEDIENPGKKFRPLFQYPASLRSGGHPELAQAGGQAALQRGRPIGVGIEPRLAQQPDQQRIDLDRIGEARGDPGGAGEERNRISGAGRAARQPRRKRIASREMNVIEAMQGPLP